MLPLAGGIEHGGFYEFFTRGSANFF